MALRNPNQRESKAARQIVESVTTRLRLGTSPLHIADDVAQDIRDVVEAAKRNGSPTSCEANSEPQFNGKIVKFINSEAVKAANSIDKPVFFLANPNRCKTREMSAKRRQFVTRLFESIVYAYAGRNKRVFDFSDNVGEQGQGWKPISTKALACLLNCNHSAVIYMMREMAAHERADSHPVT